MRRLFAVSLLVLSLIFFVPAIALPFMQPSDTLFGLDGSINVIDHAEIWDGMDSISGAFYYLGDMICHQEQDRSFMFNGNQMYVCMRDISIFTGFIIGILMVLAEAGLPRHIDRKLALILIGLFITTPIEWGVEHIFEVDLPFTRCITGALSGAIVALVLLHLVERDSDTVPDN